MLFVTNRATVGLSDSNGTPGDGISDEGSSSDVISEIGLSSAVISNIPLSSAVISEIGLSSEVISEIPLSSEVISEIGLSSAVISEIPLSSAVISNIPLSSAVICQIPLSSEVITCPSSAHVTQKTERINTDRTSKISPLTDETRMQTKTSIEKENLIQSKGLKLSSYMSTPTYESSSYVIPSKPYSDLPKTSSEHSVTSNIIVDPSTALSSSILLPTN